MESWNKDGAVIYFITTVTEYNHHETQPVSERSSSIAILSWNYHILIFSENVPLPLQLQFTKQTWMHCLHSMNLADAQNITDWMFQAFYWSIALPTHAIDPNISAPQRPNWSGRSFLLTFITEVFEQGYPFIRSCAWSYGSSIFFSLCSGSNQQQLCYCFLMCSIKIPEKTSMFHVFVHFKRFWYLEDRAFQFLYCVIIWCDHPDWLMKSVRWKADNLPWGFFFVFRVSKIAKQTTFNTKKL